MHCDLFKIYCAPPNLGITRTWICRFNFAQRPIFSGLRFFNEPEISESGPLPEDLRSGFLRPEKNPSTSAGFEPTNLGSRGEHVTPRPLTKWQCDVRKGADWWDVGTPHWLRKLRKISWPATLSHCQIKNTATQECKHWRPCFSCQ